MTKFLRLNKEEKGKETVFTHIVDVGAASESKSKPEDFMNVLHLGWDKVYGDVFKCWNEDAENFTLYFGQLGTEHYQAID